ncbi:hypothetical protein TraAM80_04942 [Trypanosoma rangeli]|uniref:Uncharacterized protein n=1 Tax=Trypanosoma rangeli TaxID=5698 RepID=A0A422NGS4_TRYRA|nr:uncharacterized protein TraAM80_04942 [Trypanosoma rangeli]RNF04647.1 hypothetical protein TraAM80_04942 [Trypanosoma rangeli]|eukprot:RNF04647.1 hypothetical protein TraAM80_04942 [Trypanosoma rangeli]
MKVSSFISQLRPGWFHLTVHAKPGARSSSLASKPAVTDAALEVRVGAPPTEGKANVELIHFMQMILEQELTRLRTVQQHTLKEGNVETMNCPHEGLSKGGRKKTNIKAKKKNSDAKTECPLKLPDKVRVSIVGGATARHKTLEVAFPGTEEELISVLTSAFMS